ncbi:FecR family protein [Parapedobacter deserti]|uniref:FecR family protein n=1 Tax=Parapedobacter deserti TaxID=1912957 RepID=A0ABV7JFH0_9SPHI
MEDTRLKHLIRIYAEGRCTPEEEAELMALVLLSEPEHLAEALDGVWEKTDPQYRVDPAVSAQIYNKLSKKLPASTQRRGIALYRQWIGWAAIILCFIAVALYIYTPWDTADRQDTAATLVSKRASQRERIKLPDGSYVTLNEGTTLRYPTAFTAQTREVSLQGEAFFEVKADSKRPFVAQAGDVSIAVLGTSFNVRAYDPREHVTVTVSKGRVDVRDRNRSLAILEEDEQLIIDRLAGDMVPNAHSFNASEATAWHRNDLYFDNTTMEEAARTIEQRFGADIRFASPQLRNCRFSGSFLDVTDARSVLEVICAFNHMSFQQTAGHILIQGQGCPVN